MFTHYIRLFSRSALVVKEAQTFPFLDSQVMVWDSWQDKVHHGLNFTVRLTASDLPSAMKKSLPTILPLTNMLAITHSAAISNPQVLFGFDLDSGGIDRQFGQVIYGLPSVWLRRRQFDRDALAPVWNTFGSGANPELDDALNRAMSNLRRSYEAATLLDEFVELYSGLESLNSPLQRKYGLPTKGMRPCRKCGELVETPISSGIKHSITALAGEPLETWKSVREMRVAITHRHRTQPNVTTGLYDNVLVLRRALPRAIFDLLGTTTGQEQDRIALQEPTATLVTTTLKGISADEILDGRLLPRFEVSSIEEVIQGTGGPIFQEPIAMQMYLTLRDFSGECAKLETSVWSGKYYDLPKGAEERKTAFIARFAPGSSSTASVA